MTPDDPWLVPPTLSVAGCTPPRLDARSTARSGSPVTPELVVLVIPFVGPILYYLFGGSPIPRAIRATLVLGGLVVYLLVAALAFVIQSA